MIGQCVPELPTLYRGNTNSVPKHIAMKILKYIAVKILKYIAVKTT